MTHPLCTAATNPACGCCHSLSAQNSFPSESASTCQWISPPGSRSTVAPASTRGATAGTVCCGVGSPQQPVTVLLGLPGAAEHGRPEGAQPRRVTCAQAQVLEPRDRHGKEPSARHRHPSDGSHDRRGSCLRSAGVDGAGGAARYGGQFALAPLGGGGDTLQGRGW